MTPEETPQSPAPVHRRRPRYKGTHPRRFSEKYKELNPEKYPDTVAKVLASGKTPAGMHRPIMAAEILQVLRAGPGEVVVDCTMGYGGHTQELLKAVVPGGKVIGIDVDPIECEKTEKRLRALGWSEDQFIVRRTNFAALPRVLGELGVTGANAILADLGLSSMQLDDPARGFTYKVRGPLDLRLNPAKGVSAGELLAKISEADLAAALTDYSDEPFAREIAAAIVRSRGHGVIDTTQALAEVVASALRSSARRLSADERELSIRRVFQAVRILVNDEFSVLDTLLRAVPGCLARGGRAAFLTFHSGEDRRVKQSFLDGLRTGIYCEIAPDPLRASPQERHDNPRSSSAKLRWAVRR